MAERKIIQVTRMAPLLLIVVAILGIDGNRAPSLINGVRRQGQVCGQASSGSSASVIRFSS